MANSASDSTWLASLLDASGAAMVGVDAHGLTVFWSGGAQTLFGWSPEDVLGKVPPIVPTALCQEWQLQCSASSRLASHPRLRRRSAWLEMVESSPS